MMRPSRFANYPLSPSIANVRLCRRQSGPPEPVFWLPGVGRCRLGRKPLRAVPWSQQSSQRAAGESNRDARIAAALRGWLASWGSWLRRAGMAVRRGLSEARFWWMFCPPWPGTGHADDLVCPGVADGLIAVSFLPPAND
jgi:hypothetical protein